MNAELVLIPCATRGHLTPALEFAKILVTRNHRLSITVLLIKYPLDQNLTTYADSLAASFASDQIKFVDITQCADEDPSVASETNPVSFIEHFVESHMSQVRSAVVSADGSPRGELAGFIFDVACLSLSDVATELGVPTYVFSVISATFINLLIYLQRNPEIRESTDLKASHSFHCFTYPVPGCVLPSGYFDSSAPTLLRTAKWIRESRGILINTALEIEPLALQALNSDPTLQVYAIGPVLSHPESTVHEAGKAFSESSIKVKGTVMAWLDGQPLASVLFLCFGSMESLQPVQIREIAKAIESSSFRFLWTLRQPMAEGKVAFASDMCSDPESILPKGFMERTVERGRVIGWAPQMAVLGHPAVGGFVSHCGWNSILESLWHGVPIATWPLFAEQQLNAFQMVVELGLGVEVKMDFRCGFGEGDSEAFVSAEVIQMAIGKVMQSESEIRKRAKEMSVKCRNSVAHGGSSVSSLDCFISNVLTNL